MVRMVPAKVAGSGNRCEQPRQAPPAAGLVSGSVGGLGGTVGAQPDDLDVVGGLDVAVLLGDVEASQASTDGSAISSVRSHTRHTRWWWRRVLHCRNIASPDPRCSTSSRPASAMACRFRDTVDSPTVSRRCWSSSWIS